MRAAAIVLVLTAVAATPAAADQWGGAASLSYDVRYLRLSDDDAIGDLSEVMDAGLTLRGVAGKGGAGIAAGLDLHAGGGLSGGFAHDVNLYPLGYGARVGKTVMLGVVAGVGVSGVTDRVPFGYQLPLEWFAEIDLGKRFHLRGSWSARWIGGADERQTDRGIVYDESTLHVDLRFNRRHDKFGNVAGNGYYVGFYSVDRMDETFYGVAIGYALHIFSR